MPVPPPPPPPPVGPHFAPLVELILSPFMHSAQAANTMDPGSMPNWPAHQESQVHFWSTIKGPFERSPAL